MTEIDQRSWWPSRYGADDQLGSLNEITPAKIIAAADWLADKRVAMAGADTSQPLEQHTTSSRRFRPPRNTVIVS